MKAIPTLDYKFLVHRVGALQTSMIGTGVYVLSEVGRKRFADFPDVLSDALRWVFSSGSIPV